MGFAHRFDPLTVCSYEVDVDGIIDLRTDHDREAAGVDLRDMACAWASDLAIGREPASWNVAERLMASGVPGILVPSFWQTALDRTRKISCCGDGESRSCHTGPSFTIPTIGCRRTRHHGESHVNGTPIGPTAPPAPRLTSVAAAMTAASALGLRGLTR